MPTLVAYPTSYNFIDGKSGTLLVRPGAWHPPLSVSEQPSPAERERLLGYRTGDTAAPGVSYLQRHEVTGRAMDAYCTEELMSMVLALRHSMPPEPLAPPSSPSPVPVLFKTKVAAASSAAPSPSRAVDPASYLERKGGTPGLGLGADLQGAAEHFYTQDCLARDMAHTTRKAGLGFTGVCNKAPKNPFTSPTTYMVKAGVEPGNGTSSSPPYARHDADPFAGGGEDDAPEPARRASCALALASLHTTVFSPSYLRSCMATQAEDETEQEVEGTAASHDIWLDQNAIYYLRHFMHP